MNKNTSSVVSSSLLEKDPAFQMITVTKKTGLGLKILGGINRNEGPLVYIQEIIPGGDCYKDGRLKPGDQLVSVNKESMIGVSFEEAKSIITRAKLRSESSWEIAFIRQKSDSSHLENPSCSSLLQATGEYGPHASKFSLISSPETLIPKTSSTPRSTDAILPSLRRNQIKTGYKKTEQIPITSSDNSPTDMSNTDIAPAWTDNYGPQGKKISLNPSVRVKVEKLEMALNYLGIQPTKEQHQALRQQVQVDTKGTVSFGDFVHVARNLFCLQLDEANVGAHEISSILNSQISQEAGDSLETDEMEKLKHERNNALEEVKTLKEKLFESERQRKQLTEELQNVKQEAKAVVEEARALRSRLHLAEAAQRQAQGMEMDYEEVIRLLEAEITELKAQLADYSDQNKAIQDVFSDNSAPLSNLSERRALLASQASLTPLGKNGHNIPATLALESKELVKSVRAILDMDCLPYGWEAAYTADGIKYFINHVTQTTSWVHPVMSALNLSCSEEDEEDGSREPPDQRNS
ncbi:syntaxin-binding protein 4 isoform X5 [Bos javanicus]|uniref:syntaxin-binding protein 4 isoform X5 n=1 Tax=Bos javanicus TaxID=9906 RepID=UPI002AA77661|nr:syntaxin-binding protein 4 isoform X5 [Bos javanicus]